MKRKTTKLFSLAASVFIAVALLILPLQSAAAAPAAGKVDLVLTPATQTVNIGDTITMTVQAQCGTQTTYGGDVYLNFNPLYLAVQSIADGTTLGSALVNTSDNTAGTIDYSAVTITPVTGTFTVATVTFTAKTVLANTSTAVTFSTTGARITEFDLVDPVTGVLSGATYTINAPADTTPPTIVSISPANTTTGVAVGTAVAVTFSEAMNQSATQGAFSLTPTAAGTFAWNTAGTVMTFTPSAPLALNTPYTVGIAVTAADLAGNPLATAYSSTFTTQTVVPAAPAVATAAATAITYTTATLNGNLTSLGTASPVSVYFEYGYTTSYGNTTTAQSLTAAGTFNAPVTVNFPVMTWHYRAVAIGTATVYGADMTFATTGDATTPYGAAKFAFVSARDGNNEIYGITPDGKYTARLTNDAFDQEWPRFAPNFTAITYTSWASGSPQIWVMNPDGTGQTQITTGTAFNGMSEFSWDETKIVFVSNRSGQYQIYSMNADGTNVTRLTNDAYIDLMPSLSPDSSKLAFVSDKTGSYQIYIMNLADSTITQLTTGTGVNLYPSWLNDNTKLSFSSTRSGTSEIYTMNADGSAQTLLTTDGLVNDQSAWCPTGGAIFYTSWTGTVPQIMFVGTGPNAGSGPFPFTSNPQGNWSRSNWVLPSTIPTFTITATAGANGSISPSGAVAVNSGANQTFTITANTGFAIASLTVDAVAVTPVVGTYTFTNVIAAHTIAATFVAVPTFTITATAGANGSISPSGAVAVNSGANQIFTITANTGFAIASLTVDAVAVTPVVGTYTFTNVIAAHTIAATFVAVPTFTITATAGANGTITPSGAVTVNSGANQTFAIVANAGYVISTLTVDGVVVASQSTYPFNNVVAAHTIAVTFAASSSSTIITQSVAAGADDGFSSNPAGAFNPTNTWWEAGSPTAGVSNNAWFRFTGITIPANAIIDSAYLTTIESRFDTGTKLSISAEKTASPVAPSSTANQFGKVKTTTSVAWTTGFADTNWHNSPDFTAVIQELLSSYTYNNGTIQILVENNSSTTGAEAAGATFENTGYAPVLHIVYHLPAVVVTPPYEPPYVPPVVIPPPPPAGYIDLAPAIGNGGSVKSSDGKVGLTIAKGTTFTSSSGTITSITVNSTTNKQTLPAGSDVIGLPYDIQPEGTTINPGLTITFSYAGLNLGTFTEGKLMLAYWDPAAKQWVKLTDSVVDTTKKTITATLKHFSEYAIMAYPLTPAAFTTANLTVTPATIEVGKDATVAVSVTNTGESSGTYTVALMVNGAAEASKDVTLNGGETQQVSFTVNRAQAGAYQVSIGGLTGAVTYLTSAAFTESNLVVNPASTLGGNEIAITYDVANTGEVSGTYNATLAINSETYDSKAVTVNAGETQQVTFNVTLQKPATYNFTVGTFASSFTYLSPAAFTASNLVIDPASVEKGDTVNVSFNLANTGGVSGTYTADLKLNNAVIDSQDVTLAGGANQQVTFKVVLANAGTYNIDAAGLTGTLVATQTTSAWLWVGLGGALVVAVLLFVMAIAARRNRRVSGTA